MSTLIIFLQSSGFPQIEVSSIVNEIFQSAGLNKITNGIKGLAYVAIVFFLVKLARDMFSGREQFSPSSFGPVLMYALLVTNWNWFNNEIDTGFKAVQTSFQAATPNDSRSNAKYREIIEKWQTIPSSGAQKTDDFPPPTSGEVSPEENESSWSMQKVADGIIEIVNIFNNPEIMILKITMFLVYMFNQCIIMLYNAFAYIWINMLKIGGIVAATLYFFPNMQGTFTNWIKTYASVYLWIPVGSIMIYVSDQIFLKVVDSVNIPDILANSPTGGLIMISQESMTNMAVIVITATATTILKLILLSKVPNIISYWINGGSTGDMFSTSSAFMMSGATAAMGAAKIGAEVASGGASGGQLAASGASDIGGSLKGDN